MITFIIETTNQDRIFYSLIEAENVQKAIDIKVHSTSIGTGTVTGATAVVRTTRPHWGSAMRDVTLPPHDKYSLKERQ